MDPSDLECRMREREYFRNLRLVPGAWSIIRLDGRNFSNFTAERFEKPFDERFRDFITSAAQAVLEDLQGLYACTHSDEISVLLPAQWRLFGRRLEKTISVSAGLASAAFSLACGEHAHFDSRVWQGTGTKDVLDYFRWRQEDAARCALHGWCYWTLREDGLSAAEATETLRSKGKGFQNELLFQHGINFNDLPIWQRRGVGLYWETRPKEGLDPRTGASVVTTRRGIKTDYQLPMGDAYEDFLRDLLSLQS